MADSVRGDHMIRYPFFDNLPYETFYTMLLRNSGCDYVETMFCDAMLQQMVKGLDLDIQDYAPGVVYVNGNYWGIHNIREYLDKNYLTVKYGADIEEIYILKYDIERQTMELKLGNPLLLQSFEELIDYIRKNSLTDEKAYQHVCSQVDIDNFIDYMIVETFFANKDWPQNNVRLYRIDRQSEIMKQKNIEAGKWRWFLFDLDDGMEFLSLNMFNDHLRKHENQSVSVLFFGLLQNPEFKEKFLSRYEYIIRDYLTTPYMLQHIEKFEENYQYEMERQIARWKIPGNIQTWRSFVEDMKVFARERPEIVLEHLKEL